ncbi:hypothetical protein HYC85_017331 [Camellia sinensis]|uniref:Uncharacterized protein n=1 Tax=Camellia sinensis TaxID=4442 RepID=A0A7J7H2A8_CAMSI|nr:hypothetical protein HYC85_017331 [Camellia sinensis]
MAVAPSPPLLPHRRFSKGNDTWINRFGSLVMGIFTVKKFENVNIYVDSVNVAFDSKFVSRRRTSFRIKIICGSRAMHLDPVLDVVRKEAENCDCLQGKGRNLKTFRETMGVFDISLGQLFVFKFGHIELKLGIDLAKKFKQKNDKTTHQVAIMGCSKQVALYFHLLLEERCMVQQSQAKEDVKIRHTGKIPIHGDASAKATLYRDRFLLLLQRLSYISNSESHWANREKMGHGRYMSVRGWPFLLGRPH